jgi:RimJ/RimL family protein N-acetyltransferase
MGRNEYISDGVIGLYEYIDALDDGDCYACWQDEETQRGYNHKSTETFEEFSSEAIKTRFIATIVRLSDGVAIGSVFVSSEGTPPDLAIMMYAPYRGLGYGTRAFSLGVRYCFETLKLDRIFAGCYPHNEVCLEMLRKCGFQPHPEGNVAEKHYLTGEDITQMDFVKHNNLCQTVAY